MADLLHPVSPTTRKASLRLPTLSTLSLMKKPALNLGLTSEGGPLSAVGGGDGEGEVSDEFEQNLGELELERFLGRGFRNFGANFFFPTPACSVAESGFSFPSSPSPLPSPSPAPHATEPPPLPDPLPTHTHWPHPQCQWGENHSN